MWMGDYIRGKFTIPQSHNGELKIVSPADFSDQIAVVRYAYSSIDLAVETAREAFLKWRKKPVSERADLLKRYQAAMKSREDQFCEIIAREVGKPLWEAKTEVATMVAKVDVTIQEGMRFVSDFEIPEIQPSVLGACRYRPLGIMAVIGPFNFPGHLANGHIVPALLSGNTVIFKPSEKSPLTAQLMAECAHEAGIDPGVFNVVQGEKELGRRLVVHEGIDGILFTGSYEVGARIKQETLAQHWKILALEMGGKNSTIVCEDANVEAALKETLVSAFITAGQRCASTSRVIVHQSLVEKFVSDFHAMAKAFKIGHPFTDSFMGPLIEPGAVDRYMKFLGIASREGCEIIMRGKALEASIVGAKGNYVAPSICVVQNPSIEGTHKSVYQQSELFAPNVAIVPYKDLEEAIAQANATQFGLITSVFTQNRDVFKKCYDDLEMGLINWNRSTVGASGRLPFGGVKKSGNHNPAGILATRYCMTPVASLEASETQLPTPKQYPGIW